MKLSEQLKKQLQSIEKDLNFIRDSLQDCQQIVDKEKEENEWLENWSRWTDWQSVLFFAYKSGGSVAKS